MPTKDDLRAMQAIRSSEKALERIRASGSFATPERGALGQTVRAFAGAWGGGITEEDSSPGFSVQRERSRTAEVAPRDSDDEDRPRSRGGAVSAVAEDKLRELNAAGLAAVEAGEKSRGKQLLEDALTVVKRDEIADPALAASTYGNYGAMLLAAGRNSDKAVDVLADAVVRIAKVPTDCKSRDLELSLQHMQTALAGATDRGSDEDIRLHVISHYVTGAQMERARKGLESLEHLRIARDLARTCMGLSHPTYKTINAVFEHSKKLYAGDAAGVLRVLEERKKAHKDSASGGQNLEPQAGNAGDDDDSFHDRDRGLGLFEKGLSTDAWSKLGKGRAHTKETSKGRRVNAGTADKTSLANRNVSSRDGHKLSQGSKRDSTPDPDLFGPAVEKKSSFLSNLLGDDAQTSSSKTGSSSERPATRSSTATASAREASSSKGLRRSTNKVSKKRTSRKSRDDEEHVAETVPQNQLTRPAAKSGLKEISVPVPTARISLKEISVPVPVPSPAPKNGARIVPVADSSISNHSDGRNLRRDEFAVSPTVKSSEESHKRSNALQMVHETLGGSPNEQCLQFDKTSQLSTAQVKKDTATAETIEWPTDEQAICAPQPSQQRAGARPCDGQQFTEGNHVNHEELKDAGVSATESNGSMQVTTPVAVAAQTVFGGTEMWQKEAGGTDAENEFSAVLAKPEDRNFAFVREAMKLTGKQLSAAGLTKTGEAVALAGKSGTQMARDKLGAGDIAGATEALTAAGVVEQSLDRETIEEIANVGAAAEALRIAKEKLVSGDSELARQALVSAREVWLVAKIDNTRELAMLDGRLAMRIAQQMLADGDVPSARESLESASISFNKAGEGRKREVEELEAQIAETALNSGRLQDAADMYKCTLQRAAQTGDLDVHVKASAKLGNAYRLLGHTDKAIEILNQGLGLANKHANSDGQRAVLESMGDTYNGVGHSEEALAVFAQAFDLAEKDLNVPGQGRTQLGMAAASADLGRHSHALSMFSKARRVFENTGDAICLARACKGQGDMYAALGSHEESLNALKKAADVAETCEKSFFSKDLQTATLEALGRALTALGQRQEQEDGEQTRSTMQHYDQAVQVLEQALDLAEGNGNDQLQSVVCIALARAYDLTQRHEDALDTFSKALEIFEKLGDEPGQAKALNGLGCALRSAGRCEEAVTMYLKSLNLVGEIEQTSSSDILASAHMGLANVYKSLGRYSQALDMLHKAEQIACTAGIELNSLHCKEWKDSIAACLLIQSNFRTHLARNAMLSAMRREFSKSMVVVQAAVRRSVAGSKYALQLKRKRALLKVEMTTFMQSRFRRALANHTWGETLRAWQVLFARSKAVTKRSHREKTNATSILQAAQRARFEQKLGAEILEEALKERVQEEKRMKEEARRRQNLEREKVSLMLQAVVRRLKPRDEMILRFSSVLLQALCRRLLSKHTLSELQAGAAMSAFVRAELCRRAHRQSVAAILLQACLRGLSWRLKWQTMEGSALAKSPSEMDVLEKEIRDRSQLAVMQIQASIRRLLQRKMGIKKMLVAKKMDSIRLLQSKCRRHRCRLHHARLLAGIALQSGVRAMMTRKRGFEKQGAALLQAAWRRYVMREAYRENIASNIIQAAVLHRIGANTWHGQKNAKRMLKSVAKRAMVRMSFTSRRSALIELQAAFRRIVQQWVGKKRLEKSRQLFACRRLQGACRCCIAHEIHRQDVAARTLQAQFRREFKRRPCKIGCRHDAVLACAWDKLLCKHYRQSSRRIQDMLQARSTLGGVAKRVVHRQNHCEKHSTSRTCQAALRRNLMQSQGRQQMDALCRTLAIQYLQDCCRMALVREVYKRDLGARLMQAFVRRHIARRTWMETKHAANDMVRFISFAAPFRRYAQTLNAAVVMQAALRQKLSRDFGRAKMARIMMRSAAEFLGYVLLAHRVREYFRQSRAARTIADACRRTIFRERYCRSQIAYTVAACMRRRRAHQARVEQLFARLLLEQFIKALLEMRAYAIKQSSCLTLQASFKRYVSRRRTACDALRRIFRGTLVLRRHILQLSAAATLQAASRRCKGQTVGSALMEAIRMEGAVQTLQAAVRRSLLRDLHLRSVVAGVINAAWLRIQGLGVYRNMLSARDNLQRLTRAGLARFHHKNMLVAATMLQAAIQRLLGCQHGHLYMEVSGAMFLQAASRQALARRRYVEDLAARTLQSALRRRLHDPAEISRQSKEEQQRAKKDSKDDQQNQEQQDDADAEAPQEQRQDETELKRQMIDEQENACEEQHDEEQATPKPQGEDQEKAKQTAEHNAEKQEGGADDGEAADGGSCREGGTDAEQGKDDCGDGDGDRSGLDRHADRNKEAGQQESGPPKKKKDNRKERAPRNDWERNVTPLVALCRHVRYGNYRDVEQRLEEGMSAESRDPTKKNNTLLCEAANHGHHRIVKLLLRHEADLNAQNDEGNTPLHLAIEFNYKKIADYLVEKGAKTNIRNRKGRTPFEMEAADPDAEGQESSPNTIRAGGRS